MASFRTDSTWKKWLAIENREELTRYKVAKFTSVPQRRIDEICTGKRTVIAENELGDKIDQEVMPIAA